MTTSVTHLADLPVVDIAGFMAGRRDDELARIVDHALRTSGFLLLTGHGVDPSVPVELRRLALEFFHQDPSVKQRYVAAGAARGWVPPASVANAGAGGLETAPDLHESIMFGRERAAADDPLGLFPPNVWPDHPAGMPGVIHDYLDSMFAAAEAVMAMFASALGMDETFFAPHLVDATGSLGLHWYPSLDRIGEVVEDQYRIGPHTDWGALTLLDREPAISGLQIQTLDGAWIDAPSVPGALTVNVGDLLARWTGDRWRSTRHRVLAPSASAPDEEIVSLVFFYDVDARTVVETLPPPAGGPRAYEPVVAGEYLAAKARSIAVH